MKWPHLLSNVTKIMLIILMMGNVVFGRNNFIDVGVSWLVNAQDEEGYWEGKDSTAILKTTYEVINTLKLFKVATETYKKVTLWVSRHAPWTERTSIQEISDLIISFYDKMENIDEILSLLLANQNLDGGFGHRKGDPSNIIDSLYALSALDRVGYNEDYVQAKVIRYLLVRQQWWDGMFGPQGQ